MPPLEACSCMAHAATTMAPTSPSGSRQCFQQASPSAHRLCVQHHWGSKRLLPQWCWTHNRWADGEACWKHCLLPLGDVGAIVVAAWAMQEQASKGGTVAQLLHSGEPQTLLEFHPCVSWEDFRGVASQTLCPVHSQLLGKRGLRAASPGLCYLATQPPRQCWQQLPHKPSGRSRPQCSSAACALKAWRSPGP